MTTEETQTIAGLQFTAEQAGQIIDHARKGKPEEVCGILRGREGVVLEVVPGQNIAEERIENYTVDAKTLLKQFAFEEDGDEMSAIYHSHPVSEAYPSATDAWNANYPDAHYVICSLEDDAHPVLRTFRLLPQWLDEPGVLQAVTTFFQEVRPGLFGYFQRDSEPVPAELGPLCASVAPPFYLVFQRDGDEIQDGRLVEVREATVTIEG